jgi:hypothetical protein
VVKVSASQHRDHVFEPLSGHDHVSLYDTSTGWFQEADSKVIDISSKNFIYRMNSEHFVIFRNLSLLIRKKAKYAVHYRTFSNL